MIQDNNKTVSPFCAPHGQHFPRLPWPNTSSERYFYKTDIGPMPIACYVLKGFSAGPYSYWESQIISFVHFEFYVLLILWDFTLEGCLDQRPHPRLICTKDLFCGYWEFKNDVLWAKLNPHLAEISIFFVHTVEGNVLMITSGNNALKNECLHGLIAVLIWAILSVSTSQDTPYLLDIWIF